MNKGLAWPLHPDRSNAHDEKDETMGLMDTRSEPMTARHDVPMTVDEMTAHPRVRVASSGSWLDAAR